MHKEKEREREMKTIALTLEELDLIEDLLGDLTHRLDEDEKAGMGNSEERGDIREIAQGLAAKLR